MTPAASPLITRADDFGASPGANDAIIDAVRSGAIRNVGVMVVGPHLDHRFDELIAMRDQFALGLHAAVNSEWENVRWGPVLPANRTPSLVRADGTFDASTNLTNERANPNEILAEVTAQLDRLRRLGAEPDYLDTHMVFSWIEAVGPRLKQLCQREGILFANDDAFEQFGAAKLEEWEPGPSKRAPVVIFHPAYRDAVSESFGESVAQARDAEARLLTDPARWKELQERLGFTPARYPAVAGETESIPR